MSATHFVGIDPGFTGALATLNYMGEHIEVYDLPTTGDGKAREFDLDGLMELIRNRVVALPKPSVVLEWPTTRPGEGAERSERFGRGKGYLHALLHFLRLDYSLVAPNTWKSRLGLPGKTVDGALDQCAAAVDRYYPKAANMIRGPRGGLLSGRIDAIMLAHYARLGSVDGLRGVVEQYGRGSPEAMSVLFRGRPQRLR